MSARLSSKVLEDGWVQVFFLLAFVSGLLTAHYFWQKSTTAAASAPIAAPPPPRPPMATSRMPGRWVVDPRGGAGVDATSLSAAVAGAQGGDVIELRPGNYAEGALTISKSLTIVGKGTSASPVVVIFSRFGAPPPPPLLQNNWAIALRKARLVLRGLKVLSGADGIQVADADLDVSDCDLEGMIALSVSGTSRVTMARTSITGQGQAAVAVDGGAYVSLDESSIRNSRGLGLEASQSSVIRLRDATLSGGTSAVALHSSAEARISSGTIQDNGGCGVVIDDGSVVLDHVQVSRSRCGVEFSARGTLEAWSSRFSRLALGAISIKPGIGKEAVIRGSDNVGLTMPRASNKD